MKKESHILAVTKHSGRSACCGQNGFIPFNEESERFPFAATDLWIGPRSHLETMETFLQVIPYTVIVRDDKIMVYQRTKAGGEARLHDKVSIGFGGHIDLGDVEAADGGETIDLETTIANAAARELREELKLNEEPTFMPYGMILDETDEVGRVHIGIVMIAHVNGMVLSNEDQIDLIGFKSAEELSEMNLESWSKILIGSILKSKEMSKEMADACRA